MFEKPQLRNIDRLDRIGAQLGILKRHYRSYIRIIERVVEVQVASAASLANSRIGSKASDESLDRRANGDAMKTIIVTEEDSLLGVGLSSAARVRFERLKDMISLYALSEVEDLLAKKEALVQMVYPPSFHMVMLEHTG